MIVVPDAPPQIALAKLGKTALLETLFETIRIPGSVFDEVAMDAKLTHS